MIALASTMSFSIPMQKTWATANGVNLGEVDFGNVFIGGSMMRSLRVLTPLILAGFLFASTMRDAECSAGGEQCEVPERFREVVNATQYAGITRFLELAQHPGLHVIGRGYGNDPDQESQDRYSRFTLNSATGRDCTSLTYDNERDLVVVYTRTFAPEDRCEERDSEVTSAQDAYRVAGPLLPYYGLHESIADYHISQEADTFRNAEDIVRYWIIRKSFEIKGIPCRGSFFRCTVSSCRPIVVGLRYESVIEPEAQESNISRQEARTKAIEHLKGATHIKFYAEKFEVRPVEEIQRVIAKPNENWGSWDGEESTIDEVDPDAAYYCWEVPFDIWSVVDGAKTSHVIWLKVHSGTVIGGDVDKWRQ